MHLIFNILKKVCSHIAIIGILAFFVSCKNKGDGIIPIYPESSIALNETSKATSSDSIYVTRAKLTATVQVSALSKGSTEMKRIYVFKKSTTTLKTGDYETYPDASFKKDGHNKYYYAIPADQKNNAVLNLFLNLTTGKVKADTAVVDDYYFAFTDDRDFDTPSNPAGMLVGPAEIRIVYGALTETTGYRINNAKSTKPSSFDLTTLTNKTLLNVDSLKDMKVNVVGPDSLWEKSFIGGSSKTLYAKIPSSFNYTYATDLDIKKTYFEATNKTAIQANVATGDMFIARIRNKETYALIKVTYISDPGSGTNTEYMEFSVKK